VKPRLLDLFCGAGGCTKGYQRAGFYVVGVDINPQPNYCGDQFIQYDALDFLQELLETPGLAPAGHHDQWWLDHFDAIHASPPCQAFTAYRRTGNVGEYPDLIEPAKDALNATGLPWVIENVAGAPLEDPLMLCGSMFDMDIQRHRYFESNVPLEPPTWPCRHKLWGPDRFPGGRSKERTGSSRGLVRGTMEIGSWDIPLKAQQGAMGVDWMTLEELSEAIPPAYTEHIGFYLMLAVKQQSPAEKARP
jgi:DNA (cytosine-5)-methyltransferase 1